MKHLRSIANASGIIRDSNLTFQDIEFHFVVEDRYYRFHFLSDSIIRVFFNDLGQQNVFTLFRERNSFLNKCDVKWPLSLSLLITISSDVDLLIKELMDEKMDSILSWIKERLHVYLFTDIRQRKQNMRLILFARKHEDGLFGKVPVEIIEIIFGFLKMKKEI